MEDNQMVSAWTCWSCANSLWCRRTEGFFVCPPSIGCFYQFSDWNAKSWYRVLDKVLNSCVIFQNKTSDGNNAFTISSPPRASDTSLLCGCLLISNLTLQSKGNRPYPNPWYAAGRRHKRFGFAAAEAHTWHSCCCSLITLILIPDSNYQSPTSLSI